MKYIKIIQVTLADLATLQLIGKETFHETFADSNSEADMKKYLENSFSEQQLQNELANPNSLFFIAWEEETPIGYLKLNSGDAQTEKQEHALEIERIYVKNSHHGKKVGQLLYEKALAVAKAQNSTSLWLGVWEENPRAIRFYEKNGFIPFDKHIFKFGNDEQTDIMMRKLI